MTVQALFDRRVRGFRLVNVMFVVLLILVVLGVYLAKAFATGERAEIARLERELVRERGTLRLLRAEVAYLEQPTRLSRLARELNMAPASEVQRLQPADLGDSEGVETRAKAIKTRIEREMAEKSQATASLEEVQP